MNANSESGRADRSIAGKEMEQVRMKQLFAGLELKKGFIVKTVKVYFSWNGT